MTDSNQIAKTSTPIEQILALQESMLDIQTEQPEPVHRFSDGVYMREVTVPKDMLIVGKMHKYDHFLMVLSGKAVIKSEYGDETVEQGHVSTSKAGAKRAIYAIEDTRIITIHKNINNSTDLEEIEKEHIISEPINVIDLNYEVAS